MSFSVRPTWITPSPSCCRNTSRPRSLRNPKHLTNGFDEELEQREDHATDQVHDDEAAAYQALLNQDYEQVEPKGVDGQALLFWGKADVWHPGYFKNSFREFNALLEGTTSECNNTWRIRSEQIETS